MRTVDLYYLGGLPEVEETAVLTVYQQVYRVRKGEYIRVREPIARQLMRDYNAVTTTLSPDPHMVRQTEPAQGTQFTREQLLEMLEQIDAESAEKESKKTKPTRSSAKKEEASE